jgi:carboxylate-amine ligase
MAHRFTLGVEEECQIVDPNTWELRSHVSELLAAGTPALGDQMKMEMHQSIVEVGTRICEDVADLRREMVRIRCELVSAADRVGMKIAAARSSRPALAIRTSSRSCSSSRDRC